MTIRSRLARLEANVGRDGRPCPGETTVTIFYFAEDFGYGAGPSQQPEVPPSAARCGLCGKPHAQYIRVEPDANFYGNAERMRLMETGASEQ